MDLPTTTPPTTPSPEVQFQPKPQTSKGIYWLIGILTAVALAGAGTLIYVQSAKNQTAVDDNALKATTENSDSTADSVNSDTSSTGSDSSTASGSGTTDSSGSTGTIINPTTLTPAEKEAKISEVAAIETGLADELAQIDMEMAGITSDMEGNYNYEDSTSL